MLIKANYTSNITMQGRNLKPISEYKGPLLKLTKKEQDRINVLKETISRLEQEIYQLEKKIIRPRMRTMQENYYFGQIEHRESWISTLNKEIRQIKINRLNKQKAAINKSTFNQVG